MIHSAVAVITALALSATARAETITNAATSIEANLDVGSPDSSAWWYGTDFFASYGPVTAANWNASDVIGSRGGATLQWNLTGFNAGDTIGTVNSASFTIVSAGNSAGNTYKVYRLTGAIDGSTTWNTKPQLDTTAFVSFTMGAYPDAKTIDVSSLLALNGTSTTFGVAILVDSIAIAGGSTGDSHFWSTAYTGWPAYTSQNKFSADYTIVRNAAITSAATSIEANLSASTSGGGSPDSSAWWGGVNIFENYGPLTAAEWNGGATPNWRAGSILQWNLLGFANPGDTIGTVNSASFTIMGKSADGNTYKVYRLKAPITGSTTWNSKPQLDTSAFVSFTMAANYALQTIDVSSLLANNGGLQTFGLAVLFDSGSGGDNFWSTAYDAGGANFPTYQSQNKLSASYTIGAPAGYSSWATTNVGGQTAEFDYDNDGVSNGVEYFMNAAPGFTANPGLVGNTVTWPNGGKIPSSAYGSQFQVQKSTDLANWSAVASDDITLGNTAGALTWKVASIANGNMDSFPSDLPSSWVVSQGTLTSAPSPDNSPFTNKFADNGISWLIDDSTDTSGAAGFRQVFSNKINYPSVEVNFDFKLTELTGGTWGIHFDGAGASAIAASSVHYRIDASGQFAINAGPGGIITDILALEADKWYNVRATFTTTEINTIDASSGNGAGFQSGSITPAGGSPVSWSNVPLLNTSLGFSRLLVRDRDATSGGDLLLDNVSVAPQGKEFVRLKVTPN
jgi:hypothetical protein